MPYFSKPIDLIKGSFPVPAVPSITTTSPGSQTSQGFPSFAVPQIPLVTSTSQSSQPSQTRSLNVHNFSPSPEKLIKMDFVQNPHHISNTTLEEISRKQNEILSFLAHAAHNVEQGKYIDSDVSTISGGSISTVSSRSSKRAKSRSLRRKRNKAKAKTPPMNPVKEEKVGDVPSQTRPFTPSEVLEELTRKPPTQPAFSGTPFTPTSILQRPERPTSPTPSGANYTNHKQSLK